MYLTIKQQAKHLFKEDYRSIRELCHIEKTSLSREFITSDSTTLQKASILTVRRTMHF
nr:hypothetical protein [Catenibacterium mitsuokai]